MMTLAAGVVLWGIAHLFPATFVEARQSLVDRLGFNAYRGVFSLFIVAALLLMVLGWRSAPPTALYAPPLYGSPIPSALVLLGMILFAASAIPGNIKRWTRHPQMLGTVLWGAAHLLTNGESRSLILFGGLTAWALLEILFINRRDGTPEPTEPTPITRDVLTIVVGAGLFALVAYFHAAWFGVPPIVNL